MCLIASSVPHRANRYFQVIDAIRRKSFSLSSLYITGGHCCISDRTGSVLSNRSFMMQMSARNAFGVRYVFDGRSHDRLAQRSSGLRMLLGPSPPSNIRRSIAPSVVGTPAPHAAAPYRASGFVLWHLTDVGVSRMSASRHKRPFSNGQPSSRSGARIQQLI
jgi:hypothetical protein